MSPEAEERMMRWLEWIGPNPSYEELDRARSAWERGEGPPTLAELRAALEDLVDEVEGSANIIGNACAAGRDLNEAKIEENQIVKALQRARSVLER
jgi:hypothetical protein